MTSTGELRAIMEDLELVDIGDAASYLGEEMVLEEQYGDPGQLTLLTVDASEELLLHDYIVI
ncbi:MAG: hypothetical protein E6J34_07305 [Chloroflexi bacterium]|nr:MAG: hypothetical protein E6J34_07305 [Chloroflexota bacterium]